MSRTSELEESVKKTKQELTGAEAEVITKNVSQVLKIFGREDVARDFENSVSERLKDGCSNFDIVKDYIHTLHDVIRLSR